MSFKVGDWVTCETGGTNPYKIINENILKYCTNGSRKNVKLWQPKEGDVCWFYDSYMSHAILGKYGDECNFWDSIYLLRKEHFTVEPYIQNALPSTLR